MVHLNWSKLYARHLSSVGLIVPPKCNHYPSSGLKFVKVSMPRRSTTSLCVKRFVTVERIARHYTLFLCQNGVLNQAIVAHLVGVFASFE